MLIVERNLRNAARMMFAAGKYLRTSYERTGQLDSMEARLLIEHARGILTDVERQLPPPPPARVRGIRVQEGSWG